MQIISGMYGMALQGVTVLPLGMHGRMGKAENCAYACMLTADQCAVKMCVFIIPRTRAFIIVKMSQHGRTCTDYPCVYVFFY
jgi:hypothetical protein